MVLKIPPPPPLAKQDPAFNRWLLEITAILNSAGDIDATAVTQAPGTNTDDIATCAFVLANAGGATPATAIPLVDATPGVVGTSLKYARENHVHPTDTSRAALASPALTGTPTAPTAAAGTATGQLATTNFVQSALPIGAQTFLAADVNLTNIANYFDVVSTGAVGAAGQVWLVTATASLRDPTGTSSMLARIWDGASVVYAEIPETVAAGAEGCVTLNALVTLAGATNFHLSCKDRTNTTGVVQTTGNAGTAHLATSIIAIRLH